MLLSPGMCWFPTPPAILNPRPATSRTRVSQTGTVLDLNGPPDLWFRSSETETPAGGPQTRTPEDGGTDGHEQLELLYLYNRVSRRTGSWSWGTGVLEVLEVLDVSLILIKDHHHLHPGLLVSDSGGKHPEPAGTQPSTFGSTCSRFRLGLHD